MTHRLIQKQLFKGSREFELTDDKLIIHGRTPFSSSVTSVALSQLAPEPVISRSSVEFVSREDGTVLASLALARPDPESFNAFLGALKQAVQDAQGDSAGLKATSGEITASLDEPPVFDDTSAEQTLKKPRVANPVRLEEAIDMIGRYVGEETAGTLINALEALKAAPEDPEKYQQLVSAFEALGPGQGAVLTYAPYVGILLSDEMFESM